jgi:hypothetical protein
MLLFDFLFRKSENAEVGVCVSQGITLHMPQPLAY